MERYYTEPTNTSSDSIIIKNDPSLDSSLGAGDDNEENYDLEVQKPAERAKILKDAGFFKKLSYRFYAEGGQIHSSLQHLPIHTEGVQDNSLSTNQTTTPSNKSELLRNRILNRLSSGNPGESESQKKNNNLEEPKPFKIKKLNNFYLPQAASNSKLRSAKSPYEINQNSTTEKTVQKTRMLTNREADRAELLFKQEIKNTNPIQQLEKFLRSTNRSPPAAIKITLKTKPSEKVAQNIFNIPTRQSIPQRQEFDPYNVANISTKLVSPRNKNIVLMPKKMGETATPQAKTVSKVKNKNGYIITTKESFERAAQLQTYSRSPLNKLIV